MTIKKSATPGAVTPAMQGTKSGAVIRDYLTTNRIPLSSRNFLDVALDWLAICVACIPIVKGSKSPVIAWKRYTSELPTEADVRRWFGNGQHYNLAVVGGWQGLVILDFDNFEMYRKFRLDHPGPSETYTVKTGRGYHVYFVTDDPKSFDLPGVEIRGAGRYVIAPPSIHPSGIVYQPVKDDAPILRVNLTAILPSGEQSFSLPSNSQADTAQVKPSSLPSEQVTRKRERSASLAQLLSAWPILDLAQSLTCLKSSDGGHGRWFLGLCMFHPDRSPSFWVDAERGRFGCHAPQCIAHRSGDVINLFALAHRVSVQEAIRLMRQSPLRGGLVVK